MVIWSPVTASQIRTDSSNDPEASQAPSCEYATETTAPVCPLRVNRTELFVKSHKRTVLSLDAEASCIPYGLYARELTRLECPERVVINPSSSASHIYMRPLSDAQATCEPSGEKVTNTEGKGVCNVCSRTPVLVHHISTSLSLDTDTKRAPLGEYAMEHTGRRWVRRFMGTRHQAS